MATLHRFDLPPVAFRGVLFMLLMAAALTAQASERLLMRATCDNVVVTDGESELAGYTDYVEISSVHHDLTMQMQSNGIQPAGPFSGSPVRVVKPVTLSTVLLMQRLAQGQSCEEVVILHLEQDSGSGALVEYWELLLETVYISERKNWDVSGPSVAQDAISFNPRFVTWTFTESGGGSTVFSWDFGSNAPNALSPD